MPILGLDRWHCFEDECEKEASKFPPLKKLNAKNTAEIFECVMTKCYDFGFIKMKNPAEPLILLGIFQGWW